MEADCWFSVPFAALKIELFLTDSANIIQTLSFGSHVSRISMNKMFVHSIMDEYIAPCAIMILLFIVLFLIFYFINRQQEQLPVYAPIISEKSFVI